MRTMRIKPAILALKDQSDYRKTYEFDGSVYTLVGIKECSVPEGVASAWAAHDSDVEIWDDNER